MSDILNNKLLLFIDGSTNNQLKVGCGAYLVLKESEAATASIASGKHPAIKLKTFNDTSSTKLELQTLIWALGELIKKAKKVVVYTDSQNIIRLPSRRMALEKNEYHSGKGKLLNNHALYREFFKLVDRIDCDFVKVEGHQPSINKQYHDRLFTLVDRAARSALRNLSN
ncbi:MAG: ribonuclease HI [Marivirga sp.]|jgi:ribonuclease HI